MVAQLTGAASILALILAYLLIVQAMMAATVLLAQYIVIQLKALRSLLAHKSIPAPVVERQPYRLGGGIKRWE